MPGDKRKFFVGFLPYPDGLAPRVALIASGIVIACALVSYVWARTATTPGDGRWDPNVIEVEGLLQAHPFPVLRMTTMGGAPIGSAFLVSSGKLGAQDRAAAYDGQPVRVRGTLIARGDMRMIELVDGLSAIELAEDGPYSKLEPPLPLDQPASQSFSGEIIDPKCYLGVMRPGVGRAHQGCAELCVIGGIPPFLLTKDGNGAAAVYLLLDRTGAELDRGQVAALAGKKILLSGDLMRWGDLPVIGTSTEEIRRQ